VILSLQSAEARRQALLATAEQNPRFKTPAD